MSRIYFDSNVYSKLRNNVSEKYQALNKLLDQHRENIVFFFSLAHIRDKKNDTSDKKFDDFNFIETFTKDNYLAYHPLEKKTSHYLATPLMVFNDDKDDNFDIHSVLDLFTPSDDDEPILKSAKALMSHLVDMPLTDEIDLTTLSDDQKETLSKFYPVNKSSVTIRDFMIGQIDLYEEMMTNHQTYKDLRKLVDEGLNNGKFTLTNDQIDFNLAFKDSALKKSFFEYVRDSFNKKENESIPYYDFFIQSYNCLDLLGISKDKLSRKNTWGNMFNDSLHSFYAQYCDYFITEDEKAISKTRALYQQFEIHTNILSVDEFIQLLPQIGESTDNTLLIFFEKLSKDIREGERKGKSDTDFGYQGIVEMSNRYLNFFDILFEVKEDDVFHYMLRKYPKHWLSAPNFREQGMILDRCINIFGDDIYQKGKFDFEAEVEGMRNSKWEGRFWKIGHLILRLQHNEALNEFCLLISIFTKKENQ